MIVAEVVYINEEREDGFYDGIWITDTTTDELIDIVWVRSSDRLAMSGTFDLPDHKSKSKF